MSTQDVMDALRQHPFTHDLDEEELQTLATMARLRVFEPNELLIHEGRAADTFFLILDGMVTVELLLPGREALRMQTVEAGEVVGWSWMVPPHRWAFDIRTLSSTTTITLDADRLRRHFETDCRLGFQILQKLLIVVARRLEVTRLRLLDFYGPAQETVT